MIAAVYCAIVVAPLQTIPKPSTRLAPLGRLGPYLVGPRIGGGGMATVHVARSLSDSKNVVAVKIIRGDLSKLTHYIDMFRDEAAILSRMQHPNVVRTVDYGVADGRLYIAMELLLGRTFAEIFDKAQEVRTTLAPLLVASMGARVASALHYAHELTDAAEAPLQIVHRDANPTNMLATFDGDVKLIDFGLAKATRRFAARTAAGVVKGKLPYLAPEQVSEGDVDARADIFSLGASLWELVTMRRLFKRDSEIDTFHAIRECSVPDLRQTVPECPPKLAAIVMRCLEREPRARFQTAAELERALHAIADRHAGSDRAELAAAMERLFPGEREARAEWRTFGE